MIKPEINRAIYIYQMSPLRASIDPTTDMSGLLSNNTTFGKAYLQTLAELGLGISVNENSPGLRSLQVVGSEATMKAGANDLARKVGRISRDATSLPTQYPRKAEINRQYLNRMIAHLAGWLIPRSEGSFTELLKDVTEPFADMADKPYRIYRDVQAPWIVADEVIVEPIELPDKFRVLPIASSLASSQTN